jgi:hypothetical protein
MITQISADQQIHDKIQILPILKRIGHVNDIRMFESGKQLSFIQHRMYTLLADDLGLMHLLHRINLLRLLQFHAPNLPESSFADHVNAIKMFSCHLFALRLSQKVVWLFELREVNFKAIFHILIRFFRDCRIAAIVFFLFLLGDLLAFSCAVLHLRSA